MKYIIALLLTVELAAAQGVVVYRKATGEIQERKVVNVIYDTDNASKIVGTNIVTTLAKWQPRDTTATKNRVLGAQVWKGDNKTNGVDWTVYDLADYDSAPDSATNISELVNVVPRNCLIATDPQKGKKPMRKKYENDFFRLESAILTLAGDPRKDVFPPPKLEWDELDAIAQPLIDSPTNSVAKAANKLKDAGFKLNMQLMRYEVLWWDNAEWHPEAP